MISKRIIPCLDVKGGRVVKGIKFRNLVDAGNPVEVARNYSRESADEIVFLDITASYEDRSTMLRVVERTASEVFVPLTVGGGVRGVDDIRNLLLSGADKVTINTSAVTNPDLVREASDKFGSQCIVVAIDARLDDSGRWRVYTHGGRKRTEIDVVYWATKMQSIGAGEILLTSMDMDGTKNGYDIQLTNEVSRRLTIPVIASGGAGSIEHLFEAITDGGADAVLCASIFHYGEYSILDVKEYLRSRGISVRI